MAAINLVGIAGSLRQKSTNKGLLRAAKSLLPDNVSLDIADLNDVPFYNADIIIVPDAVQRIIQQVKKADGLIIACTEYNYSIAPALKNILDWISRDDDKTLLAGKPLAIMGSGGGMGTSRAQYHLRQVCVFLELQPLNKPEVFSNAFSGSFDADGNLVDEKIKGLISQQISTLVETINKA
ncbi:MULTISPECIES: NADPH-dependent FMN reductase [unclassified Brenneria]|uniref:NADPH-dependent FMN reductase n=1 Tax=unclassified Brenneria TaxID=2634434 RepID=UPI001551CDFC|nr:NAD(P)H-dependent oxidoreductase [Brenneria sp. hezel4-2-4]MEE3649411.1 NAD(P)H-dependent oxidoreductase [Brenneria sp. HEZEL_4_2_4]NPC99367.1 NAD(P)H-dependent oxidoreductase [Brenneria sp. hezel4-2-4]